MTAPKHEERAHSVLGASASHRWMACPGSIRLQAGIPNVGSIYAAEGTAAHEVAELCLSREQDAIEYVGRSITVGNHVFEVDEEMAEAVQVYLDAVRAEYDPKAGDVLMIEQRFDLSNVILPGMFGSNDACVYKPNEGKLIVFDYKHGKGHPVEADANPQLMYYGVGAATMNEGMNVSEIELAIVQPRAPHKAGPVRRWTTDALDLIEWMGELKSAAEATKDPNAPLVPGEHCKFCLAAAICPALREKATEAAMLEFSDSPADLTPEQLESILAHADLIEDWVLAVRKHALNVLEAGGSVPGYKLVEKRAQRRWAEEDPATMAVFLENAFDLEADALYAEPKLKTPAQVEKLLPKTQREALKEFVVKESSGTTMAPASDPRPPVAASRTAAVDFAD